MQAVYDGLANAQPQTGALRKAVFFVKAFEDMFLGVFRDTASRVFDKDGGISFPVRDIAEGDAARYREFLGIVYQVVHDLLQADGIGDDQFVFPFRNLYTQLYIPRHTQTLGFMDLLHDERQVECSELKVHRARFYAREVQNIVYQRQQQRTVDVDCFDELLYLFRRKASKSFNKSEKPTMAFRGVRISWLILARNADLSLSACKARSRAAIRASSVSL